MNIIINGKNQYSNDKQMIYITLQDDSDYKWTVSNVSLFDTDAELQSYLDANIDQYRADIQKKLDKNEPLQEHPSIYPEYDKIFNRGKIKQSSIDSIDSAAGLAGSGTVTFWNELKKVLVGDPSNINPNA